MANKSKRFNEKVEDLPGPGAYMIEEKENNRSLSAHEIRVNRLIIYQLFNFLIL